MQCWMSGSRHAEHKAIINIPTTVENAMPHVFACQIEYIHKHLKYRDNVVLSVHPHNDRGCGISDAELGILAGADRVEGTLFRKRRAHRKRGYCDAGDEYVLPRCRSEA